MQVHQFKFFVRNTLVQRYKLSRYLFSRRDFDLSCWTRIDIILIMNSRIIIQPPHIAVVVLSEKIDQSDI